MEENALNYTVKKRKATRIAYRLVGVFFVALGAFFVATIYLFNTAQFKKVLMVAFGVALFLYGVNLVKSSFRKSAFNLTYFFDDESLRICGEKKEWTYAYNELGDVQLVIPDPDFPYYMIKIDTAKDQFVLNFMGSRKKCDEIYYFLMRKTGILVDEDDKEISDEN